ncbi:MAG: sensor domain-containing phosphodiesterase [Burkholderiaceae bacterium]
MPAKPSALHEATPSAAAGNAADVDADQLLQQSLAAVRTHLGMEVAFISEFAEGRRVYRHVDAAAENPPIRTGDSDPLERTYCQRVVDGRLPALIPDTRESAEAMRLDIPRALPIAAHASVPIGLRDGRVYGTLCCFSSMPHTTLNDRDTRLMQVVAELVAGTIEDKRAAAGARQAMRHRIEALLETGNGFSIAWQPICDIATARVIGVEALSRFPGDPARTPDVWFTEAAKTGLGAALEASAIGKALTALASLPAGAYLAVNVSPETVACGALAQALAGAALDRIVVEITEHASIPDYADLHRILAPLRAGGLRVAVDDAGAGYASFRHILKLAPDIIKLDISLTRGIDTDRAERALAAALIRFAEETGSAIVSEGVETAAELRTLRQLGVTAMQGFLLGRPAPLAQALAPAGLRAAVDAADAINQTDEAAHA